MKFNKVKKTLKQAKNLQLQSQNKNFCIFIAQIILINKFNLKFKLIKLAIKSFKFKIFNHLNSNNTWKKFNKVKRNKY